MLIPGIGRINIMSKIVSIILVFCLIAVSCEQINEEIAFSIDSPGLINGITKVSLSSQQQDYVEKGNEFNLNLLRELYSEKSLVVSPLSVQMALGMTLNGAEGKTAQEIINTLGYGEKGQNFVNEYFKILIEQLPSIDKSVTLRIANSVISRTGFELNNGFINIMKHYYYAPAATISFDRDNAVKPINDWVSRNTEGKIYPFIESIDPYVCCLLLNTLYLKARWTKIGNDPMFFPEETIKNSLFTIDKQRQTKVDYLKTKGAYLYKETESFQVLALPYSTGKYYMYFLLPKEQNITAVKDIIEEVSNKGLNQTLQGMQDALVRVKIPIFSINSYFELKNTLKQLGIKTAFDESTADFSSMFNKTVKNVSIGDVLQKTSIEIAEWGTEAASVSAVKIVLPTSDLNPVQYNDFYADHPFVFIIADSDSKVILFEGVFSGVE